MRYYTWQTAGSEQESSLREAAEQDLSVAVDLDPSRALAWVMLSDIYRVGGRFGEARAAAARALEADAFLREAQNVLFQLCNMAWEIEDLEEAIPCWKEYRRRFPKSPAWANADLMLLASSVGPEPDAEEAWRLYETLEENLSEQDWVLLKQNLEMTVAGVLARAGLADSAYAVIRRARAQLEAGAPWPLYFEANVRLHLGEKDLAIQLLREFLEELPDRKAYIASDWWWRPLRDDPRFQALVAE